MIRVAVLGDIGSGKSYVASNFGYPVFDADLEVSKLYRENKKIAFGNAKLIMKKTKCDAVKLESNNKNYKIIEYLVDKKIPVMGHIGFTPQFKKKFKVEGQSKIEAKKLLNEALKIDRQISNRVLSEIKIEEIKKIVRSIFKSSKDAKQ